MNSTLCLQLLFPRDDKIETSFPPKLLTCSCKENVICKMILNFAKSRDLCGFFSNISKGSINLVDHKDLDDLQMHRTDLVTIIQKSLSMSFCR